MGLLLFFCNKNDRTIGIKKEYKSNVARFRLDLGALKNLMSQKNEVVLVWVVAVSRKLLLERGSAPVLFWGVFFIPMALLVFP